MTLHIWGFHEAELGVRVIDLRLPDVERMFREAKKILEQGASPKA